MAQRIVADLMGGVERFTQIRIVDGERLTRQVTETTRLANLLRMRKLSIPRDLNLLPAVHHALMVFPCHQLRNVHSKQLFC